MDLVAEQLRVAAGERLSLTQDEVRPRGHAIECRINAEDPAGGRFLPSPGTLTRFSRPGGFGVRIDAGYGEGDTISQHYKVLAWGQSREEARRRILRVLREMTIEGVITNVPAHLRILEHPDFINAVHSTRWVEERLDFTDLPSPAATSESDRTPSGPRVPRTVDVEVEGRRYQVRVWAPGTGEVAGPPVAVAPERTRRRPPAGSVGTSGAGRVTAPMQGTIVEVVVAAGDQIEVGQAVCVLEAMKMENQVDAERAGTVTEVR
ncbi:MAG: biotin/lipoyl-containing protein, partial [Pyrinomonadaceae bacterium]